ncbi:MAG: hypothetical protein HGA85_08440 [Nanoarchaeota archaeon]|nr:hypothetical protein [Nanoarchaeota archaeon]
MIYANYFTDLSNALEYLSSADRSLSQMTRDDLTVLIEGQELSEKLVALVELEEEFLLDPCLSNVGEQEVGDHLYPAHWPGSHR